MIDRLLSYIKYVLLHRWNKVDKQSIEAMDKYWLNKPTVDPKTKKLYLKIKELNK